MSLILSPPPSEGEGYRIACVSRTTVAAVLGGFLIGFASAVALLFNSSVFVQEWSSSSGSAARSLHEDEDGEAEVVFSTEGVSGDEDKEEDWTFATSTTIVCIVLLLIGITISFDWLKEHVIEHTNNHMKPVIESLFGEMTVLGFLSVSTFVISKSGLFEMLSVAIFGEGDEFLEMFETVHYCLFFVMILFVVQVLVLAREGEEIEAEWLKMDRVCRDPEFFNKIYLQRQKSMALRKNKEKSNFYKTIRAMVLLMPYFRDKEREARDDKLLFHAMREEFILERSLIPPFQPANPDHRVPDDFNFGRYLSVCLGHTLSEIVEVHILTWMFMAVLTTLVYSVILLLESDNLRFAWFWVGLGWFFFCYNLYFEFHLIKIRFGFAGHGLMGDSADNYSHHLVKRHSWISEKSCKQSWLRESREDLAAMDGAGGASEDTPLNDSFSNGGALESLENLPAWCRIDIEEFRARKRTWLAKLLWPNAQPNRHDALFWTEKKGPFVSMLIVQINLVFTGVYVGLLVVVFYPIILDENGSAMLLLYMLLTLLPSAGMIWNKKHMVSCTSQVCSVGAYRRPQLVANVLREEKIERVVRAFIVLYKMHRAAMDVSNQPKNLTNQKLHYSESLDSLQVAEVEKTFHMFDHSGDGNISIEEFDSIMRSLGVQMSPERLNNMIAVLDVDGDGEVSKEEFLQWYADEMGEDDLTNKERALYLFKIFDQDDSGEITLTEFKTTLDAFNLGFTVDEIGDIVRELDEDGDGVIGLHEFEQLLEKYE